MKVQQTERALIGLTKVFINHQPPLLQSEVDTVIWAVCGYCLSYTLLLANDLGMAYEYGSLLFFLLDQHTSPATTNVALRKIKAEVCILLCQVAAVDSSHTEVRQAR